MLVPNVRAVQRRVAHKERLGHALVAVCCAQEAKEVDDYARNEDAEENVVRFFAVARIQLPCGHPREEAREHDCDNREANGTARIRSHITARHLTVLVAWTEVAGHLPHVLHATR